MAGFRVRGCLCVTGAEPGQGLTPSAIVQAVVGSRKSVDLKPLGDKKTSAVLALSLQQAPSQQYNSVEQLKNLIIDIRYQVFYQQSTLYVFFSL